MKIYYTDLNKQSYNTKKGKKFILCGIIFLVLFIISAIIMENNFAKGSDEIKIAFIISMIILVVALIILIIGALTIRKKFLGNEDLRMFVYHNNDLYILENSGVSGDHFSTFRMSIGHDNDAITLLLAVLGMSSHNDELKEKINESRNEEKIISNLRNNNHNIVQDVEIVKDSGHTVQTIIRTVDGARRSIEIGNNYIDYEELISLLRNYGGRK